MKRFAAVVLLIPILFIFTTNRQVFAGQISGPMLVSDNWPQCTDVKTWADDVLRIEGKTAATDREKALTLYQWTRLFVMGPKNGTEPYEGPYNNEVRLVKDTTRVMFVYGYGDCDYQARALEAAWCVYKNDNTVGRRTTLISAVHTMCELKWNATWHAFDSLNGIYFIDSDSPTANVLSFAQIAAANDQLLKDNELYVNRCRPFFERVRSWTGAGEWKMHLDITGGYDNNAAWVAGGSDPNAVYATQSDPLTYTVSDMNWYLPRGITVDRLWDSGTNFYVPQAQAASFGAQGRHYRQATEWGTDTTHWYATEDIYNFPKCEPYLKIITDPNPVESFFYNQHTLLFSTGTLTYNADLWSSAYLDAVQGTPTLVQAATPPYLRPSAVSTTQNVTFRIRCPFTLADATLSAKVICGTSDTAVFKLSADNGVTWDTVASGGGTISANIGKSRFNGTQQSVTGKYDFLVRFECDAATRVATVGLCSLKIDCIFDSSIRSLPRIIAGTNTMRVKVADSAAVAAPINVVYRWKAGAADQSNTHKVLAADFAANVATYTFDAPGFTRCSSYTMTYGGNDEDANGLPDSWEVLFFGTTGQNPADDPDSDGFTNSQEADAGTDPMSNDTDGDGVLDGADPDPLNSGGSTPPPPGGGGGCGGIGISGLIALIALALRRRRS